MGKLSSQKAECEGQSTQLIETMVKIVELEAANYDYVRKQDWTRKMGGLIL